MLHLPNDNLFFRRGSVPYSHFSQESSLLSIRHVLLRGDCECLMARLAIRQFLLVIKARV